MKKDFGKWFTTIVLLSVNVLLWAIPSKVAYLVTQQRDILLGRYTVARVTMLLPLIPVTLLVLYITWSKEENKRKHQFQVIALSVSVFASVFVMDVFLRLIEPKGYIIQDTFVRRLPSTINSGVTRDVPEAAFSYPITPAGYPDIKFTLTIDKRGFRNKTDFEKYDVVVVGDSFTEGSGISDDQTWAALLAQKTKNTIYNLGMSGGHPGTYLETIKRFGLELSPKIVICMLYEGNDFRNTNFRGKTGLAYSLKNYFKSSPIRRILQKSLVHHLGTTVSSQPEEVVGADDKHIENDKSSPEAAASSTKAFSWLPLAIPQGPDAKYYAFKLKSLLAHFVTGDTFLKSVGCRKTFAALREIKKVCNEKNIRFIVVYAPDKPNVLLPLVRNRISPEQLHAFMSLKAKKLPPQNELMDAMLARLNIQESEVEQFCRQESIEFISLTQPLRQCITEGKQAYFTYDQHWTPIGHEIAANALLPRIKDIPRKDK